MNAKLSARLILSAACGAMAGFAHQALNAHGRLVSWDLDGHLLRAHHFVDLAVRRPGFTAWFPYWHGGFPLPEVYPPLTTWLLAVFVSLGWGTAAARTLLLVVWIGIVPCSYFFLRSLEVDHIPAALGASLVLGLDSFFTFGSYAIFSLGLLPNGIGFLLAVLAVASTARLAKEPSLGLAARAAFFAGLTILAHPFASVWAAGACALIGLLSFRDRPLSQRIGWLLCTGAWALVIGSFYWAPFLANRTNLLVTNPFVESSREQIMRSIILLPNLGGGGAAALALLGIVMGLSRSHGKQLVPLLNLAGLGILLTTGFLQPLFSSLPLFGHSQMLRFEGFYGWAALMVAAMGIDAAFRAGPAGSRLRQTSAVLGAAAAVVVAGLGLRNQTRLALAPLAPLRSVQSLGAELKRHFRPGDFILTENDIEMASFLGSPHFFNQQLPLQDSSFWDQGGGLPEGTKASDRFSWLSHVLAYGMPNAHADLGVGGIRFIITGERPTREALEQIPWLKRLWVDPMVKGMALFEVEGEDRRFGLPAPLSTRIGALNFSGDEGYILRFTGAQKIQYPLSTALSYHPWLRTTADGISVATTEGALDRLVLSRGPDTATEIQIRYVPPWWIFPVRIVALLALLASLLFGWANPGSWASEARVSRSFSPSETENP